MTPDRLNPTALNRAYLARQLLSSGREDARPAVLGSRNGQIPGTVLVDGMVAGTWSATRRAQAATVDVALLRSLSGRLRGEVEAEGHRLLDVSTADGADRQVCIDGS